MGRQLARALRAPRRCGGSAAWPLPCMKPTATWGCA